MASAFDQLVFKEFENHIAAVALYIAHYDLCCVNETLRITADMQLGVIDHTWGIGELVEATQNPETVTQEGRRVGWFTVIDGDI